MTSQLQLQDGPLSQMAITLLEMFWLCQEQTNHLTIQAGVGVYVLKTVQFK